MVWLHLPYVENYPFQNELLPFVFNATQSCNILSIRHSPHNLHKLIIKTLGTKAFEEGGICPFRLIAFLSPTISFTSSLMTIGLSSENTTGIPSQRIPSFFNF